jgi:hypothetical protein
MMICTYSRKASPMILRKMVKVILGLTLLHHVAMGSTVK